MKFACDVLGSCEFHIFTGRVTNALAVNPRSIWCDWVRSEFKVNIRRVKNGMSWHTPLILSIRKQGQVTSMSSAWSTYWVLGQLGLCRDVLSQKIKTNKKTHCLLLLKSTCRLLELTSCHDHGSLCAYANRWSQRCICCRFVTCENSIIRNNFVGDWGER